MGTQQINPTQTTPDNFYGHDLNHLLFAWVMLALLTVIFLVITIYFQKRKDVRR